MDTIEGVDDVGLTQSGVKSGDGGGGAAKATPYSRALGERIRTCRGAASREAFKDFLGVHVNTVGKFERGESMPDAQTLVLIAEHGRRSAQWLLTGEDFAGGAALVPRSLRAMEAGSYVYVPHFDIQASAGNGFFNDIETVKAMRPFDVSYIRNDLGIQHDELALITVVGTSMEPDLHSRDTVMLDLRSRDVLTEGIHAVRLDGALLVKKLQRLPGRVLRVASSNSAYSSFDIEGRDDTDRDFAVIGRVRWGGVTFN